MLSSEQAVLIAMVLCLGGAAVSLFLSRTRTLAAWFTVGVTAAAAVAATLGVFQVIGAGPGEPVQFLRVPRIGFALRIHVDGLTAVFLLLTALISVPAALYSVRYLELYPREPVARYHVPFLLFLAALYGLVSTTDMMWFFFIFWQLMTIPGYLLIRFERNRPDHARAASRFLWMMQVACAATMIGAELLATTGAAAPATAGLKYDFAAVGERLPLLLIQHPAVSALAFALFLLGFGIKMGMWPLGQVWLPDAHPAAPSPVSALLSGVMIKTGVYGLLRYFLWLVPPEAAGQFPLRTWGILIAALGTITLFTGTLQALQQDHSKRLLAFHSIGQVGYILLGAGASMTLLAQDNPRFTTLSAVALLGALFHVINHGLFKALLFLNAGSLVFATRTQDLNRMGGLLRVMPLTGITALVASLAIAGVPPLNGYASKWTLYTAMIGAGREVGFLTLCAAVALLTSTITLASFIKFFGASFLGQASDLVRSRIAAAETESPPPDRIPVKARGALEVPVGMQIPQAFLAGCCVLAGVAPAACLAFLARALAVSEDGLARSLIPALPEMAEPVPGGVDFGVGAVMAPLALVLAMGALFLLALAMTRLAGAKRRADPPWLCGYATPHETHRYLPHSFYDEVKQWCRKRPWR